MTTFGPVETLRIAPWRDELVEAVGIDPRSRYVELFWLPVLGPSAGWLMRRFADGFDQAPSGYEVGRVDLARALGLGGGSGRSSPLQRAIQRCARFDLARHRGEELLVRRLIAPLPRRHLPRLPEALRQQHRRWEADRRAEVSGAMQRRAHLLALDLTQLGEEPARIERHLVRWGVPTELAGRATGWASFRTLRAGRATS